MGVVETKRASLQMLAIEHEVHGYQSKIFRRRAVADKFIHFVSEVVGAVVPGRDDLRHAADRLVLTEDTESVRARRSLRRGR